MSLLSSRANDRTQFEAHVSHHRLPVGSLSIASLAGKLGRILYGKRRSKSSILFWSRPNDRFAFQWVSPGNHHLRGKAYIEVTRTGLSAICLRLSELLGRRWRRLTVCGGSSCCRSGRSLLLSRLLPSAISRVDPRVPRELI